MDLLEILSGIGIFILLSSPIFVGIILNTIRGIYINSNIYNDNIDGIIDIVVIILMLLSLISILILVTNKMFRPLTFLENILIALSGIVVIPIMMVAGLIDS